MIKKILYFLCANLVFLMIPLNSFGQNLHILDSSEEDSLKFSIEKDFLKLHEDFKKGKNTYRYLCSEILNISREDIPQEIRKIIKEIKDVNSDIYWRLNSITETNDVACRKFLEIIKELKKIVYPDNEQNQSSISTNQINDIKDSIEEVDRRITELEKTIEQEERNSKYGKESDDQNGKEVDKDKIYFCLFVILFILTIFLFYKNSQLKKSLKRKASKHDLDDLNGLKLDISSLNEEIKRLKENSSKLAESFRTLSTKQMATVKPSAQSDSIKPQNSIPTVNKVDTVHPANDGTIIYVAVDGNSEDRLWKGTSERTDHHLYEIHLTNPEDKTGELRLCPNRKPDFEKMFIEQRQSYFNICEITPNGVSTPTQVKLKKPGTVIKDGNDWKVIVKPVVELV